MRNTDEHGHKNNWRVGATAYFEYHCTMSHDSCDAELWYRSHQKVVVLRLDNPGNGATAESRIRQGEPRLYWVRWPDGHEYCANEDELLADAAYFCAAFNPPPDDEIAKARAMKKGNA